jgi:hypothetical protein
MKRYVLERRVMRDEKTNIEQWVRTKLYADDPIVLTNFLSSNFRIFDTKLNWVHRIKRGE